jgi:hypothetical protein
MTVEARVDLLRGEVLQLGTLLRTHMALTAMRETAVAAELFAALEGVYAKHRRDDCPTDTAMRDHEWQHHKGVECRCVEFDHTRAVLAKARSAK